MMHISSNTGHGKQTLQLLYTERCAWPSGKSPASTDTFILIFSPSFNVLVYTYTVAELLNTVFLHFHSPRL